jgi:hypothetical protein
MVNIKVYDKTTDSMYSCDNAHIDLNVNDKMVLINNRALDYENEIEAALLPPTGAKDIKDRESFLGDILKNPISQWSSKRDIEKANKGFYVIKKEPWSNNVSLEYNFNVRGYWETNDLPLHKIRELEIVGSIYTDEDMIKKE